MKYVLFYVYRCTTSTYVLVSSKEQYKCYGSVHLISPCMAIVNSFQVHSCCYAVHIMVFGVSPSECVGWYKWTPATTAVHNLHNAWYLRTYVCKLVCRVPKLNMVQRKCDAHAHSRLWGRRTQQSSHTHVGC